MSSNGLWKLQIHARISPCQLAAAAGLSLGGMKLPAMCNAVDTSHDSCKDVA